jgi:hypothetical protein
VCFFSHRCVHLPHVGQREYEEGTFEVTPFIRPPMYFSSSAFEFWFHIGRDHHDLRLRLQKLSRLPVRDLASPDDHTALVLEVEEYRIKNSALDLLS